MTAKVIEKNYRPHGWVFALSFLFFGAAASLLLLPRVDRWMVQRQQAQIAATPAVTVQDAANADLEKEAQSYQVWLEKEPGNVKALRGLIDVRLKQNNLQGAIAPLETLTSLYPDATEYAILTAQVKQASKDYEGAATIYRQLLTQNPYEIPALQGMANLLLEQNRPEGAIGLLQNALKSATQAQAADAIKNPGKPAVNPNITSIQLILGQVYADQKRDTEALTIYEQAAQTDKNDFRPVLAKAMILKQQGRTALAQPFFTTAISLAPPQYKDQIKQMATSAKTQPQPQTTTPTKTTP
jgi:tetratricopeptide (TPR) repeat protein